MRVKVFERPTPELRYMNGVLQQSWRLQWRDDETRGAANPETFEWRDVPTAGPAASPDVRRRIVMEEGCPTCAELAQGSFGPYHDPSPRCESGKRPHCTCDICF